MDVWNNLTDANTPSTLNATAGAGGSQLLTEHSFAVAYNYVLLPLRSIIGVLGIVTNSLCIRAFYRTGTDDSVTLVLFFQVVLDLCFLVGVFAYPVLAIASFFQTQFDLWFIVRLEQLRSIVVTFTQMFIDSSAMVTAFLAVQRFLCVALPLHFKGLFTRRRTVFILLSIFFFHAPLYLVLVAQHEFEKTNVSPGNLTLYVVAYAQYWGPISNILFSVVGIALTTANQFTITFCVIFMTNALVRSVRFRMQTSSVTPAANTDTQVANPLKAPKTSKRGAKKTEHTGTGSEISSSTDALRDTKELLVIKQVVLVCTIYLICNTPRLIFSFGVLTVPEFQMSRKYSLLFRLTHVIKSVFEYLNSSLNFFVYFNYNDKFRKACFRSKGK